MRAPAVGVSVQARDAMRVAWGAGAAHLAPGATYRHEELCDGMSPPERWSRRRPADP